jgi:hypothetical protein
MYQKKIPKSQEAYKSVYICHNPHTVSLTERKWPDRIRIISVDPGITSFSVRVEERNIRRVDTIKTLLYDKVGLKKEEQELTNDNESKIYSFIQTFLDQHVELFRTCHMVIIEKQLPINYRCVRISQHTLTYFMILLKNIIPSLAMFFEVAPTLKGRELGAGNLNEKGIKLWSVEKARELLITREDKFGLSVLDRKINGKKEKKDDLSDTLVQIEALFSHMGWPLTQKIETVQLIIPPVKQKDTSVKLKIVTQ